MYSKRDWGHAKEYVEAMWLILNQKLPEDFVISTNSNYTVKEFINLVCKKLKLEIYWTGKGLKEKCINRVTNKPIIGIDKNYFRPLEVNELKGSYLKAKKILKWKPKIKIKQLVEEMVDYELKLLSE